MTLHYYNKLNINNKYYIKQDIYSTTPCKYAAKNVAYINFRIKGGCGEKVIQNSNGSGIPHRDMRYSKVVIIIVKNGAGSETSFIRKYSLPHILST
jgi:hypothetical protein